MYNDYELLYLAQEHNEDAINILYVKYKKVIYSKVSKYNNSKLLFDDYINEAKLAFYDAIEYYKDDTSFLTYLNKCMDNKLLNCRKSLNRNKNKILNEAVSINDEKIEMIIPESDERYNPETMLMNETSYHELKEKILSKLTWQEELIFTLKEQDYTNKEISEITDNNLKTVYNIINRIKNKISNIMSS